MKFIPKNSVKKFQLGGEMPTGDPMAQETTAPEEPATPDAGQDPIVMLAEGAAQALQSGDCNIAMLVCQGLIQLVQQMSGSMPPEPQGEPVFRKGGRLLRRIKK